MDVRRNEVLVTGDDYGAQWNLAVWDPSNGTSLATYKGGVSALGSFNVLGSSYIVTSLKDKPLLNVWRLDRHEQVPQKITTPGKLKALSASPNDGRFLAGSLGESIYLWQSATGRLIGILNKHFQEVSRLAWTDDGSFLISAGKDGSLIAWSLPEILSSSLDKPLEPFHIWNDSSLEITDLIVGRGGPRARIFTCSMDHIARIYDLPSKSLLREVTFSKPLSSIAVDASETRIFLGSTTGDIHTFSLREHPSSEGLKSMITPDTKNTLKGHKQNVTCLSVSLDGKTLASGSEDKDVRLWDAGSRQTLRTISCKGSVSVLSFLSPPPRGMLDHEDYLQEFNLCPLEKNVREENAGGYTHQLYTPYGLGDSSSEDDEEMDDNRRGGAQPPAPLAQNGEVERLKKINLSLYQSAVDLILNK